MESAFICLTTDLSSDVNEHGHIHGPLLGGGGGEGALSFIEQPTQNGLLVWTTDVNLGSWCSVYCSKKSNIEQTILLLIDLIFQVKP